MSEKYQFIIANSEFHLKIKTEVTDHRRAALHVLHFHKLKLITIDLNDILDQENAALSMGTPGELLSEINTNA